MNKNQKRISAAVLALALGFSTAGAGIFAPVAGAQIGANQISSINMGAGVTLNIEKNVGLPVADGDTSELEKLEGAQFLIQKIEGIDLQTLEGWEDVAALDPANITNTLTTIDTLTTDASGLASISTTDNEDFTVGVYLVTETAPPGYTGAAPFIVTLPFTDATTGAWSYNQTVKPKNQEEADITKKVSDAGATLGSVVPYTISSSVPAGTLTSLVVEDQLPTELTMVTAAENVAPADVVVTSGATTLTPTADYEVALVSGKLTVTLTATGLGKINGGISVTFDAKITSLPSLADDETIENHATININDGAFIYTTDTGDPTDPTDPGTGAQTRLSQLTINKVDSSDAQITGTTQDAEFELWRCNTADAGVTYTVTGSKLSALASSTATTPVSTFVVDGQATLYGVQVLDWVNGETATDTLCVVETKAPTGYALNPAPQPVTFTAADNDGYAMVADVTNLTTNEAGGGQLPSTGGMGTLALIAGGLVVAAAGGAAAIRGNRARS